MRCAIRVAVWSLCAAGLAAQAPLLLRSADGSAPGDQRGFALCGVGDIDGDGLADYAVAEPFFDNGAATDCGRVQVVAGRTGQVLWTFTGAAQDDHFGWSIAGVGDLDGDGHRELAVGAPDADHNGTASGTVYLFRLHDGSLRTQLHGGAGDQYGMCVAAMGDIDGDGRPDLGTGAPLSDLNGIDRGYAQILAGTSLLPLFAAGGAMTGDHYGHAMTGLGDVDGDGRTDFLVTAPWSDQVASKCGSAMVYSSVTQQVLWTFTGTGLGHEFGHCAADPRDCDGDGRADIAVAAPEDKTFGDDSGSVRVHSGLDGSVLHVWYGNSGYDYFGNSIDCGDVDGDGVRDLLVGAPLDDLNGTNNGVLRGYSLRTGALLWTLTGPQNLAQMARTVACPGDCNGDGFADLLLGAPYHAIAAGGNAGNARLFAGIAAQPATWTFGHGCPPGPGLELAFGAAARVGQPLQVQLLASSPAPANAPCWLAIGVPGVLAVPVDLTPLGLPGCTQYVELDLVLAAPLQNGSVGHALTVPPVVLPHGIVFGVQGAMFDPSVPGSLRFSRAGRAVVLP